MSTHVAPSPSPTSSLIAPPRSAFASTETGPIALQWRSPARNLWVGQTPDRRYVGMIERRDIPYVATDDRGIEIGSFDSLGDAEAALGLLAQRPWAPAPASRIRRIAAFTAGVSGAAAIAIAVFGIIALGR